MVFRLELQLNRTYLRKFTEININTLPTLCAGQFNLFVHSLCWKHAERPLKKLHIHNKEQQKQYDEKMDAFWQLYQDLKTYKTLRPHQQADIKSKHEQAFENICQPVENFTVQLIGALTS